MVSPAPAASDAVIVNVDAVQVWGGALCFSASVCVSVGCVSVPVCARLFVSVAQNTHCLPACLCMQDLTPRNRDERLGAA